MSKSRTLVMFGLYSLLAFGCTPKTDVKPEVTVTNASSITASAVSRLEQADLLDGKSDHVIGKCYVCSLGMDGSEKFAAKVGDFTAHLCSKSCQQEFEESAEKIVLQTEIPKDTKQE